MLTADLRHGVGDAGRARRLPAPAGGGREARPPASRAASSTCSPSRRSSGPVSWSGTRAGGDLPQAARGLRPGPAPRARLRPGRHAAPRPTRAVGHRAATLAKYADNMYPEMRHEGDPGYFVKPMNCPFHVLVYKSQIRSYRDLPMRLSELGSVYRYERLGVAARAATDRGGFTQDDSHIICREDQLVDEILGVFDLTLEIHRTFGFTDPVVDALDAAGRDDRDAGDGRAGDRAPCGRARTERPRLRGRRGRGFVLRAEGRLPLPRRDRPAVAAHDRAVRLRPARALRDGVRRARTTSGIAR